MFLNLNDALCVMGLGLCSVPLSTPYPSHGELFPLISDELLVSGSLPLLFCLAWVDAHKGVWEEERAKAKEGIINQKRRKKKRKQKKKKKKRNRESKVFLL